MSQVNMSQTIGLREQKKISNRKAILNAGLEVFSTLGYERTTITDIVSASGLSVGTFYNHCGDKHTIYSELVSALVQDLRCALNQARTKADSLESFVMGAFAAYSELMASQPKMQQLIGKSTTVFREFISSHGEFSGIIEDLERDMQTAVDTGLSPSFPVRLMTSAMIAASVDIFSDEVDADNAKEKAEFLGNLFLGGIQRLASLSK